MGVGRIVGPDLHPETRLDAREHHSLNASVADDAGIVTRSMKGIS
jgi:hypothetical protein